MTVAILDCLNARLLPADVDFTVTFISTLLQPVVPSVLTLHGSEDVAFEGGHDLYDAAPTGVLASREQVC